MNYDEKKEFKKKKYKKYTLSGLMIIVLTFLLEYSMEFLLDGILKSFNVTLILTSSPGLANLFSEYTTKPLLNCLPHESGITKAFLIYTA